MFQMHRVSQLSLGFALTALLLGPYALIAGDSPWYVETKLGDVELDARFGTNWTTTIDDEDDAAIVEVGYAAHRYISLQAGYYDLGEHSGAGSPCPQQAEVCVAVVAPVRAELSGFSVSAVPRWPISDRWAVFGKLGLIDWQSDMALNGNNFGHRRIESFDDRDLLTGLGLRYEFPGGLGLLAERQNFDLTGGWFSFGGSWRF